MHIALFTLLPLLAKVRAAPLHSCHLHHNQTGLAHHNHTSHSYSIPVSIVASTAATESISQIVPTSEAVTTTPSDIASDTSTSAPVTTSLAAGVALEGISATTSATQTAVSSPAVSKAAAASGGQVGIALNGNSGNKIDTFVTAPDSHLSWYYNWGSSPSSTAGSLEYVPMVWGSGSVASIKSDSSKWPSGTKYVLSFNEPDMTGQNGGSNISPADGAKLHQQWTNNLGGSFTIGAPAVAGWDGGVTWLKSWRDSCNGACTYDFIPFHYYGNNANDLITYATNFYNTFDRKPLWLTEFACQYYDASGLVLCSADEAKAFMDTAVAWFRGDGADIVERWSWFGAFTDMADIQHNPSGIENSDGSANALGQHYVGL